MNWESDERIWNILLAVHKWLFEDLINKVNHAAKITDEDFQPFFDARQALTEEQFQLDGEIFRMSKNALEESLYTNLMQFFETTNSMIQARDSGDQSLRETLQKQMEVQYNRLVQDFEQQLHNIKAELKEISREGPRINLPSLRHVGGGIMIDSPHADQDNRVINVGEELNMDTGNKYSFGNITGSNVNIDSTLEQVTQNIGSMNNIDESVKKQLAELIEQLKLELQKAPSTNKEDAEAIAESAKALVEASTKAQPNKTTVRITAEGLKKAAENIAGVMPNVLTIAYGIVKTVSQFAGIPLP